MTQTINVRTRHGVRIIPADWVGQSLAIHRPVQGDGLADKGWAITHLSSGRRLAITGNRRKAERFARQWDQVMQTLPGTTSKALRAWDMFPHLRLAVLALR